MELLLTFEEYCSGEGVFERDGKQGGAFAAIFAQVKNSCLPPFFLKIKVFPTCCYSSCGPFPYMYCIAFRHPHADEKHLAKRALHMRFAAFLHCVDCIHYSLRERARLT